MVREQEPRGDSIRRGPTGSGAIARLLCAAVLISAAVLKWHAVAFAALPSQSNLVFGSRALTQLLLLYELTLATFLVAGVLIPQVLALAMLTFSAFAAISLMRSLQAETSCGCFGALEMSPWISLAICSALVAISALTLRRQALLPSSDLPGFRESRRCAWTALFASRSRQSWLP